MAKKEKILLSYLATGGGHIGAARALGNAITELYGDEVELFIYNAVNKRSFFQKRTLEKGYSAISTQLPFLWPLVYEISKMPWLMTLQEIVMSWYSKSQMAQFIKEKKITKIVNLHFLLNRTITNAKRSIGMPELPVVTVVTDPFTLHPIWTHELKHRVIVFTNTAREIVASNLKRQGLDDSGIRVFNPMINPIFNALPDGFTIEAMKEKHGFSKHRPILLIAGGGEGLPGAQKFIKALSESDLPIDVFLVTGKNHQQLLDCEAIVNKYDKSFDSKDEDFVGPRIKIFGFVNFMYDLMCVSTMIAGKAGPATVFEAARLRKPFFITTYIYGQEAGNKDFVLQNKLGSFVPSPKNLIKKVEDVLVRGRMTEKIPDHPIVQNGSHAIAKYIVDELE